MYFQITLSNTSSSKRSIFLLASTTTLDSAKRLQSFFVALTMIYRTARLFTDSYLYWAINLTR
jgi:hypothetical protein